MDIAERLKRIASLAVEMDGIVKRLVAMKDEAVALDVRGKAIRDEIGNVEVEILKDLAKDSPEVAEAMATQFGLPLEDKPKKIDEKVNLA